MKVHIEHEGITVDIVDPDAYNIYEIINIMCNALVGVTFSQEAVYNGILAKAEEIENMRS